MEDFIADTDEESTASSDKSSAPKQLVGQNYQDCLNPFASLI